MEQEQLALFSVEESCERLGIKRNRLSQLTGKYLEHGRDYVYDERRRVWYTERGLRVLSMRPKRGEPLRYRRLSEEEKRERGLMLSPGDIRSIIEQDSRESQNEE